MTIWSSLIAAQALASGVMFLGWVYATRKANATIVDVLWTANLGLIAALFAAVSDGWAPRRWMVLGLAAFWSVRLAAHLYSQRMGHATEDGRYVRLRASWGGAAKRNFFLFFQAQAVLDVLLAVPFLLAMRSAAPRFQVLEFAGAALLVVAVIGETIADRQLHRFRVDPANRGKTCRAGLWSWSRHPNYFFEWLNWCAFALVAWPAPLGPVAVYAPLLMLVFVLKITGIPPTEAHALASRGDDYREYQRTVSAFFPMLPKGKGR